MAELPNYMALVSGSSFNTGELAEGAVDIFINLDLKTLESHPGLARVQTLPPKMQAALPEWGRRLVAHPIPTDPRSEPRIGVAGCANGARGLPRTWSWSTELVVDNRTRDMDIHLDLR